MQLADLADQRTHGDRVLEQTSEVGVVAAASGRGAPELGGKRARDDHRRDDPAQGGIVDLADQVLQEALELLHRSVGGRQELAGVEGVGIEPANVVELRGQLTAVALDPAPDGDRVPGLEPKPDPVGVAEDAGTDRSAGVAQAQRQVRGAVSRRQALLREAGVAPLEPPAGPQLGDCGMDLGDRGLHIPILAVESDPNGVRTGVRAVVSDAWRH